MKLYDGGRAPNPRRVRIFLAEKGVTVPTEQVDLGQLQQRSDAFTALNPMQRCRRSCSTMAR
jgi:glutathione S-transferase